MKTKAEEVIEDLEKLEYTTSYEDQLVYFNKRSDNWVDDREYKTIFYFKDQSCIELQKRPYKTYRGLR